ncbi:MAG: hypothetical protein OYL97_22590 [Candidatus Poribacteria bacterium]|nr:hypothetical protein [Candidatus Poribacteria bacterium]MDE0469843.1 hypothetical protein [Candidatus Poribacteria bacterium]
MFIEIINQDGKYNSSYRGMLNIQYVHQIQIIKGRHRSYELHINLSNSPSIELLGTKEECEQFYNQLQEVLKTYQQLSVTDTLIFPPRLLSETSLDRNDAE